MPHSLPSIAVFNFTSSLYNVIELAEAEVIVQIEEGSLLADAQVTVRTLGGSATGMCLLYIIHRAKSGVGISVHM